jgi:hypothetical protein
MKPEMSLLCSQIQPLVPMNIVHILKPYFFKINFNIILRSKPDIFQAFSSL